MLWVKCINKIRNKQGLIIGYKIEDLKREQRIVTKEQLKDAMMHNKVCVLNLKLSADNKIIDRSEIEQSKLEIERTTEKDEILYNKAVILGCVPEVNKEGYTVRWPNTKKLWITSNVHYMLSLGVLKDRTVIFCGNNKLSFAIGESYDKAIICNPNLLINVEKMHFAANTILLDFDGMDIKVVDMIFKRMKDEINHVVPFARLHEQYEKILIGNKKLLCDDVYNRVIYLLKREEICNDSEKRCYDLINYLRLIYCMYLSFKDASILRYAPSYINEYCEKISDVLHKDYKNTHIHFLNTYEENTSTLIHNINDALNNK